MGYGRCLGGPAVTAMRDHLAAELARKVSQKGLVVWQDSEREYAEVAESLCPPERAVRRV